ncbi:TetR/AcrR family transcriptional regulator [Microbispora hainanensis]|uniref:TetR/AcrR family transcriptional regulator n=1 Tax=Microbispora hainanensis TaxID=568844 RepID=A0A544Y8M0_9ACTN|nr:TetR/AcrR family transcriptional regulator [Microbispora hainanensis]TQS13100.1 TetR/AcrR family transcriptional regulator [Microbispora hainanensis]
MTDTTTRRRAPAMSTEQRRAMIVAAALPLVAERGAAVTTSQIARAAGIGEGTVFRVFADKDELLDACVTEATDPGHVLRELASISLDDPLADRLAQAVEALRAHLERMGAVIGALHGTGHRPERGGRQAPEDRPGGGGASRGREASMRAIHEAMVELIEPDRAALRLEPEKIASVFMGMLFVRPQATSGGVEASPEELVDILLHGTLKTPGSTA